MSSTSSPDNSGNAAAVKDESPAPIAKEVWRIDMAADSPEDFIRSIIPLIGVMPDDNVYSSATLIRDARGLGACTVRFSSETKSSFLRRIVLQDQARDYIWTKIKQLQPDAKLSSALPNVTFSELPLVNGRRKATLDLVFPNVGALRAVKHLDEIRFDGIDGEVEIFNREVTTDRLPGNILAIDCPGLPIDNLDCQGVFAAFQSMAQSVGKVVGIGKVVTRSDRWGVSNLGVDVRIYIEIHPDNMLAPWKELMLKLVTHLRVNGVPYPLLFPARHLHGKNVFSANFNVGPPGSEGSTSSATSSAKRSRAAEDETDEASTGAKRSRRAEEVA